MPWDSSWHYAKRGDSADRDTGRTPRMKKNILEKALNSVGLTHVKREVEVEQFPPDFSENERAIYHFVRPYTMTSSERVVALTRAVDYIESNDIRGSIVECGVWRGGSAMAIARTLMNRNSTKRELYLFDTFEGMSPPTEKDVTYSGTPAAELLENSSPTDADSYWCYADLADVSRNLKLTAYPTSLVHLVKGKVEETVPQNAPDEIALLRLDTDWYESTKHELTHLYPRLVRGGVLIIDDYGHWKGAREATDEYLAQHRIRIFLNRIDYTGRIAIKVD